MIDNFHGEFFFLSNFYEPAPVTLDGENYPTTEHAYQAAKTSDPEERKRIQEAPTPGKAKRLGRQVVLRPGWDRGKDKVMLDLCRQKFRDPDLRALLLATGDEELVEGNDWGDVYWGVCSGKGLNKLGKVLMQIRQEIRTETG